MPLEEPDVFWASHQSFDFDRREATSIQTVKTCQKISQGGQHFRQSRRSFHKFHHAKLTLQKDGMGITRKSVCIYTNRIATPVMSRRASGIWQICRFLEATRPYLRHCLKPSLAIFASHRVGMYGLLKRGCPFRFLVCRFPCSATHTTQAAT